jgi:hypothetical protein
VQVDRWCYRLNRKLQIRTVFGAKCPYVSSAARAQTKHKGDATLIHKARTLRVSVLIGGSCALISTGDPRVSGSHKQMGAHIPVFARSGYPQWYRLGLGRHAGKATRRFFSRKQQRHRGNLSATLP